MTRLGNWWRYFRRRGFAGALEAITERYIYRSHRCVITRVLLEGPAVPDHLGDVVFRLATPSDLDRLGELNRYGRGSIQRIHVERDKDWLFVACHGERIVATRRISLVTRDAVISRVFQLGPGQVWGADTFCVPDYRNRGIARDLQKFSERYLVSLGYRERFGSIVVTNTPSLRMSRREILYYVSHTRFLFWERLGISKDIPRRLWDGLK